MKKLESAEPVPSSDFWYDLILGWYFDPKKFIEWDDDIARINNAIETLQEYKDFLEESELFEEM